MKLFCVLVPLALLLVAAPALPADPASRYAITDLGTLGGGYSEASAINNAGIVVGTSQTTRKPAYKTSANYETHAFLWNAGRMRDLGTLGGGFSAARAINDHGEVVGYSDLHRSFGLDFFHRHAFLYSGGKMRDLGTLPGNAWSEATAINSQEKIVGNAGRGIPGRYGLSFSDRGVIIQQAVLWSGGRIRALAPVPSEAYGINRYDQIAGKALGHGFCPFVWSPMNQSSTQSFAIDSEGWGFARAINARGQAVGNGNGNGVIGPRHAFVWQDNGATQDLPPLLGYAAGDALALNNLGAVVGVVVVNEYWHYDPLDDSLQQNQAVACLWENGVARDLNALIPSGSGWTLREATGINDKGWIVGNGIYHNHIRAFLLRPAH